jgi:hypothetical protein
MRGTADGSLDYESVIRGRRPFNPNIEAQPTPTRQSKQRDLVSTTVRWRGGAIWSLLGGSSLRKYSYPISVGFVGLRRNFTVLYSGEHYPNPKADKALGVISPLE